MAAALPISPSPRPVKNGSGCRSINTNTILSKPGSWQKPGHAELVLEVGPVPQGVISPLICQQTQLGLETLLDLLAEASQAPLQLRSPLRLHRHSGSLDLPRDSSGQPTACLHPARLKSDWTPLEPGAPLFQQIDGDVIPYAGEPGQVTVFSNEAAYQEKHIATSLARPVSIPSDPSWSQALSDLLQGVER